MRNCGLSSPTSLQPRLLLCSLLWNPLEPKGSCVLSHQSHPTGPVLVLTANSEWLFWPFFQRFKEGALCLVPCSHGGFSSNCCTVAVSWAQAARPMPGTHRSPSAPVTPGCAIPPFPPPTHSTTTQTQGQAHPSGSAVMSPGPQALSSQLLENEDHLKPKPWHVCHVCPSVLVKPASASLCYVSS